MGGGADESASEKVNDANGWATVWRIENKATSALLPPVGKSRSREMEVT